MWIFAQFWKLVGGLEKFSDEGGIEFPVFKIFKGWVATPNMLCSYYGLITCHITGDLNPLEKVTPCKIETPHLIPKI